jgi:hypothetical protein
MSIKITLTEKEILEKPNDGDLGKYVRQKYLHEKYVDENIYDFCLVCGKQSPYTKTTNIDNRIGYIDGAGQGCFTHEGCE